MFGGTAAAWTYLASQAVLGGAPMWRFGGESGSEADFRGEQQQEDTWDESK
ncbi:MAG: hypothetical protein KDA55_07370 [Planctomycetales bacterium]|nr:hypothetical protein [Planctomycetales bacterium]